MGKHRASVAVFVERKVNEIYSSLNEKDDFKKAIDKGLEANVFAGEIIRKR